MEHAPTLGVGIDVSKRTLDVVRRSADGETHTTVTNDARGIANAIRQLAGCTCPVVLESTGRYHLLAAFRLSQAGLSVRVVNPLASHRYLTAAVRKQKTDKVDAAALAHMAAVEQHLPAPFGLSRTDIQIRQKMGLVSSLETQLQSLRGILTTYAEFQGTIGIEASAAERSLGELVRPLQRQKAALEAEIEQLVASDDQRRDDDVARASTVPGVSRFLASLLCQVLRPDCESARQWIAFVGLDISLNQSGQWRGHGRLSKRGNAYLRKRLFQAAWGAMRHDAAFRAYYDRLRKAGRGYRAALVILARKLLRILFAVRTTGQPYLAERCLFPVA